MGLEGKARQHGISKLTVSSSNHKEMVPVRYESNKELQDLNFSVRIQ